MARRWFTAPVFAALLVIGGGGCDGSSSDSRIQHPPSVLPSPPPKARRGDVPPQVWAADGSEATWLPTLSYCWSERTSGICVDTARVRQPVFRVGSTDPVTLNFLEIPKRVRLTLPSGKRLRLPSARMVPLRVEEPGRYEITAAYNGGNITYVLGILLRPQD